MKFQINDGLGLISIGMSEIGSYFRSSRLLSAVCYDCEGSAGKYLWMLPYDPEYRNEVRNRILGRLNDNYADRIPELKELLDPLLKIFPSGEYSLGYYNGDESQYFQYTSSGDNHQTVRHYEWSIQFAPLVNDNDKEPTLKKRSQQYSFGGFYDVYEKIFVATQPASEINEDRVKYFEEEISKGARPFAIVFKSYFQWIEGDTCYTLDSNSYVIDGHHKLQAYENLKMLPAIVEITHLPTKKEELEFNVEILLDALYPWQIEHIFNNWDEKDQYISKLLKDPDSNIHRYIKNGFVQTFHANGRIANEAFYVNDKIEGQSRSYYDSGQLRQIEFYKNYLRHGEWKSWYPSGALQFVQPFDENGRYDGHMISYYESGKVRWEQFLKNGVNLDGYSYLCWFEDGTKEAELEYLNGQMIKRKNYNRSGEMINFEELDPETNRLVKRM